MLLSSRSLRLLLPMALFFGVSLSQGVTIEQTLVLEQSGGLKAAYVYEIPNAAAGTLSELQRQLSSRLGATPNGGVLDEAAVRRQFSGIRGVYMENYACFQLQDRQRVEFSVVALDASVALASGAFGPFRYTAAEGPAETGGSLELAMPSEAARRSADPAHAARLAELLGGFQMTLTITAPAVLLEGSTGEADGPMRRHWRLALPELLSNTLPRVLVKW